MDIQSVPCLVINLASKAEHWINMKERCAKAGFKRVKRFNAVDGTKLDEKQMTQYLSVCAYNDLHLDDRRGHEQIYTPGSVGCYLSHYGTWKYMIQHRLPYAFIFEDDVLLDPYFEYYYIRKVEQLKRMQQQQQSKDNGWDVALFGYFFESHMESQETGQADWRRLTPASQFMGTHCYLLTLEGAKKLVKHALPIEVQVDSYLSKLTAFGLRIVYSTQKLACQDIHVSSIQTATKKIPLVVVNPPLVTGFGDMFYWLWTKAGDVTRTFYPQPDKQ